MAKGAPAKRGVTVQVLYFALLREVAGRAQETMELPGQGTIAEIGAYLAKRHPRLAVHLPSCRLAVNGEFVAGRVRLKAGDELAVLPPVAGG